jgi:hypothetical protein
VEELAAGLLESENSELSALRKFKNAMKETDALRQRIREVDYIVGNEDSLDSEACAALRAVVFDIPDPRRPDLPPVRAYQNTESEDGPSDVPAYVCPQCGPAPEGADAHAERAHTWPPSALVPADIDFDDGAEPIQFQLTGPFTETYDEHRKVIGVGTPTYTFLLWPDGNVTWKKPE